MFFTVNRITVAGKEESSVFNGMNGEKASNETTTGAAGSLYSTKPIGYSPRNDMSAQPERSSGRSFVSPPLRIFSAKPWSSGEAGFIGLA